MNIHTDTKDNAGSGSDTLVPAKPGQQQTGAQIVVAALRAAGVDTVFGYPGAAVLPIYDELFGQNDLQHILVRHEQAAVHAAEGYARSTGKLGVVLVTSGPGATNTVTGLADALMDSIPVLVVSGQVATHLIGTDAFQEADTVGITRPCTKHNWLVSDVAKLHSVMHEAIRVATEGRPGPVVVDIPKNVQIASVSWPQEAKKPTGNHVQSKANEGQVLKLVKAIESAKRPVFYTGGGVINSGAAASTVLTALVEETGFPITSTLMGLGAYPASGRNWLGMLGLHGLYQANKAMHACDLMINVGARFDDRVTGALQGFSPGSTKAHVDVDPSSINKVVQVDIPIIGDAGSILLEVLSLWRKRGRNTKSKALADWWQTIAGWKAHAPLEVRQTGSVIKPQHAIARLNELTKDRDRYISTEVGQHQMWAAQYFDFEQPNRWMTSGGLGTMGYGFPASIGVQIAHPDSLVINVAGEASWMMNMQELGTVVQYGLPVKQFILNNERLGMVRQLQEVSFDQRYSNSWSEALPDFVKFAEAYGVHGIRCVEPSELDGAIREMIDFPGPVVLECVVEQDENVLPMIRPGQSHDRMLVRTCELAQNSASQKASERMEKCL